jgi:hypothetical protein
MFIISHLAFGTGTVQYWWEDTKYACFPLGEESPHKVHVYQMDILITYEKYPIHYPFIHLNDDRLVAGRLYTPRNNPNIYEEISKGNLDLLDGLIRQLVIFDKKTMILAAYEAEGSKSSQTLMKCLSLD